MRTILGVLVIAVLIVGCSGAASTHAPAAPSAAPTQGPAAPSAEPTQGTSTTSAPVATASGSPSALGAFGGIVHYQIDGGPATTEIDAVADGASVSGTAVTAFRAGTHTVRLGCAARYGGTWVLGGTTEKSTVPGEPPGAWSAVTVKDGSPQQIAVWLSADLAEAGASCDAFLASFAPAELEPGVFAPVESGVLVPPPDPIP
jgi:hypothetical protein